MSTWTRIHFQELERRCHQGPVVARWTWRRVEVPRPRLQLLAPSGDVFDFKMTANGLFLRRIDDGSTIS